MIQNIQALRGIACLMVLFFHGITLFEVTWLDPYARTLGPIGVDIFFVISGFVICRVATSSERDPLTFAARRFIRIFPIYWVVFLAALLTMYTGSVLLNHPLNSKSAVRDFFLTTNPNHFVPPAWSLSFEVYFYAVVAIILLIAPNRVIAGIWAWMAATALSIAALALYGIDLSDYRPFNCLVFEFAAGVAVAQVIERKIIILPFVFVVFGAAGILALASIGLTIPKPPLLVRSAVGGVAGAALVYGMIGVERQKGWIFGPLWRRLGDASYSIYLWHMLLLTIAFHICKVSGILTHTPPLVLALSWSIFSIAFGMASYRCVETPLIRLLRAGLDRRHASASAASPKVPG